ncbi:MAG: ExbD/TolR family protein [Limisphaerales bacterium]
MKFPRNTRLLRSPFEMAPFAAVFFLFAIFLMLAALMPTPGIPLQLPVTDELPGIDQPSVSVAVDSAGRYYFGNQVETNESQLAASLVLERKNAGPALTMVIHADKSVTYDQLVHLTMLAYHAGIQNSLLATMPRPGTTGP